MRQFKCPCPQCGTENQRESLYCSQGCRETASITRFKGKRIESGDCLLWQGTVLGNGYGQFKYFGRKVSATHFAWYIEYGNFPPEGLVVAHTCDTPLCVNPDHLWLGTSKENQLDCCQKGRRPLGVMNGNSKIEEEDVKAMREKYARGGITLQALGDKFGMSKANVCKIINRDTWSHI